MASTAAQRIDPAHPQRWVTPDGRDPRGYRRAMKDARAFGPVRNAGDVYRLLRHDSDRRDQEQIYVVLLDVHGYCRRTAIVARGGRDHVSVELADTLRPALVAGCRYFAIAHNHPTGDARPSQADGELTLDVQDAANESGLYLLDHVILGLDQFFSFRERRLFVLR
jgi:DNA repair protein RadC